MHVDGESSEESEEEVRSFALICLNNTQKNLQEEEFYSPGSLELLDARRAIAEYSLPRLDLRFR